MTLSTIERIFFLRGVRLFHEIPGEELVPVAQAAQEVQFSAGEIFIEQGDPGESLYIIVDGLVDVVIEGLGTVTQRGTKDVLGELGVISRKPRSADCVAVTNVSALKIDQDDFWELLETNSGLALGVIQMLATLFEESVTNLRRLSTQSNNEDDTVPVQ
jgi:CRP-like cAMP-binding protein